MVICSLLIESYTCSYKRLPAHILHICLLNALVASKYVNITAYLINLTDKHIIGSIRNPWDWYVSLWAFGCVGKERLYRRLIKEKSSFNHFIWRTGKELLVSKHLPLVTIKDSFASQRKLASLWRRVYKDGLDAASFRAWLRLMFDPKRSADIHEVYGNSSLSRFTGFLTYRDLWLY